MQNSEASAHHYHACGHAFSGRIRRPIEHVIEVQAGMSLPSTGGFGISRSENFHFQQIVSFKAAHTKVSGSHNPKDDSHTTLVSATVEGLNILDVITADRVVARLSSHYPPSGDEPVFTTIGSHFDNLRIAGCPVEVHLDGETFSQLGTFESFKKRHDGDAGFRKTARERIGLGKDVPEFLRERYKGYPGEGLPESKGFISCTLVRDIETKCPEVKRHGHALSLEQFGRIFLGELSLGRCMRELTMMRVELGSPVAGDMSVGGVIGNGYPGP